MLDTDTHDPAPEDAFARPRIDEETHPVFNGLFVLPTRACLALLDYIIFFVAMRMSAAFVAPPRYGKTMAGEFIKIHIPKEGAKGARVYKIDMAYYKHSTKNNFFEHLLKQVKHALWNEGKHAAKVDRFKAFLIDAARANKVTRVVLLFDEAQLLTIEDFEWLKEVHNELEKEHVKMITFLFGQRELEARREVLKDLNRPDITARFMFKIFNFPGIDSEDDLQVLMDCYDHESEFPEGSGWSYTRFFWPAAFEAGWRLSSEANTLWKHLTAARSKAGLRGPFTMEIVVRVIEYVVRSAQSMESKPPALAELWPDAVESTYYADAGQHSEAGESAAETLALTCGVEHAAE